MDDRAGSAAAAVDDREDVASGVTVGVGQTVTFPTEVDASLRLWAVAVGGTGEVTYLLPAWAPK